MAKQSFSSILDQESSGVVERPKPLPQGTYLAVIKGPPEFGTAPNTGTEFVRFSAEIVEAFDDVDEDDLKDWAERPDGSERKLRGTTVPNRGLTFYITPDAKWRLEKFLDDLGALEKGTSLREMVHETGGREFIISIVHVPSQDGEAQYANVKSTAPVEKKKK
jgi:hypothetical protein